MKKVYLLFIFIVLYQISAIGQNAFDPIENAALQDTVVEKSSDKNAPKRVSDFKVYAGISASKILLSNSSYESAFAAGYILGFSYRKGRFGYWEIGLNYNGSVVALDDINLLQENMRIGILEIPLTVGTNLLSATRRVVGLRIFGGIVPGYISNIGNNSFDLEEDDFNRFQLAGRVGVGVDVFFLFVEAGYQYGFLDLIEDKDSNLSQLDFRLGFRF